MNDQETSSDALVTFTLLSNAQNFIQGKDSSIRCLFDLSILVDAILLHPVITVMKGKVPKEILEGELIVFLKNNKLLNYYNPTYNERELITILNQYSIFRFHPEYPEYKWKDNKERKSILDAEKTMEWGLKASDVREIYMNDFLDYHEADDWDYLEDDLEDYVKKTREWVEKGEEYNLFKALKWTGTGHLDLGISLFRTLVYLASADYDKLTFYPDCFRIPYITACSKSIYSGLSRKAYKRIAEAIEADVSMIAEEVKGETFLMPPFFHLLLNKMSEGANFYQAIMDLRYQYTDTRDYLYKLDFEIKSAETIHKTKELLRKKRALLSSITRSTNEGYKTWFMNILSFAKDIEAVVTKPLEVNSYNQSLVLRPLSWIKDWWARRPIVQFIDLCDQIEKLPNILEQCNEVFDYTITLEDILTFKRRRSMYLELIADKAK